MKYTAEILSRMQRACESDFIIGLCIFLKLHRILTHLQNFVVLFCRFFSSSCTSGFPGFGSAIGGVSVTFKEPACLHSGSKKTASSNHQVAKDRHDHNLMTCTKKQTHQATTYLGSRGARASPCGWQQCRKLFWGDSSCTRLWIARSVMP